MSLENTRELFHSAAYMPASLQLEFQAQQLWGCLSGQTKSFIWIAAQKTKPGPLTFKDMWGHVWADDPMTLAAYDTLSMDEKAEVLGFFTFQIHELTHRFDFLITPYGANFQSKLFREYRAFQRFAPLFLREVVPPQERFVDYDPLAHGNRPSDAFIDAWKEVHDIVATLEALGDGGMYPRKQNITLGWGENNSPIEIFNHFVNPVTVHGFFNTITSPDEPDWYLRPSTIFETRAVVHCLMWIMKLFGSDERAREPLSIYLDSFYAPAMIGPDYTFLLNVIATGWGNTFPDFVRAAPMLSLRHFLMMTDASCWYALQAPPPMPDASAVRSSPIIRLMHALRFFNSRSDHEPKYSTCVDALNDMDSATQAATYELTSIGSILAYSAGFTQYLQQLNQKEIRDPVFRRHFDHVLGVQHRLLSLRLLQGYISYSGMPEDGHPVLGLRSQEEVDALAPDSYLADTRVREWFSFRYDFLYRHLDSATIATSLKSFFGTSTPG